MTEETMTQHGTARTDTRAETTRADTTRAGGAVRSGHRPARPYGRLRRVFLGGSEDPRWARPAMWGVLAVAVLLYTWALGASGNANSYYAAAILSGTHSWKAFFFGALDSGSFITVDKPPVALWVMGLSARIFGFGTWSMLLPQAAAGVASVGLVYSAVRRGLTGYSAGHSARHGAGHSISDGGGYSAGHGARYSAGDGGGYFAGHDAGQADGRSAERGPGGGRPAGQVGPYVAALIAAVIMTLTPITVAINRDNNPDTILVLLLVAAAWFCAEAIRTGRMRTLVISAVLIGFAFNTKMLQAYLVLPGFAAVYLYAARGGMARRLGHLLVAGVALVVSSAWWMIAVDLWPASSRPYIGGSANNTVWDLVIGYNGLGRVFGQNGVGGLGGGGRGNGASFGGAAGAGRLFNDIMAGQISWLLPFAALALIVGLILIGRRPRLDLPRATLLLWGGWLVVHSVIFSFSSGTFHPYYSTAMAPAVAAVTGVGGVLIWEAHRRSRRWAWVLPLGIAVTGAWSFTVLRRTADFVPWLAWAVAGLTVVAVVGLLAVGFARRRRVFAARLVAAVLVAGLFAGLAGPAAYAVTPLSSGANGTNPTAGPAGSGGFGGMGGGFRGGMRGPGGGQTGQGPGRTGQPGQAGQAPSGAPGGMPGRGFGGGRDEVGQALIDYLRTHRGNATWLVAVSSAQSASSIILSTGEPVIAMGGFTGSDPAMTVDKLKRYVAAGQLTYVLVGSGGMGGPDRGNSLVTAWVEANGTAVKASEYGGTEGGQTLYKLS